MEIPNSMVLRAAEALHDAHCKEVGLDEPFGAPDRRVEYWTTLATAAIKAAFAGVEVVRRNEFDDCDVLYASVDCDWRVTEGTQIDLHPGDTLLILRGGGEGEHG